MCFSAPALPEPAPAPPTQEDPAIKAKAEKDRLAAQSRRGLLSTVKTPVGTGSPETADPNLKRKTALGE